MTYYEKHREARLRYQREYYAKNREREIKRVMEWKRGHIVKVKVPSVTGWGWVS